MVALAGSGWRLAPSLVAMFDQADQLWPSRSHASDGSIGDASHQAKGTASDHNPDASGDVLAGDLTDDKKAGCDADAFAEHLVASRDHRVRYVICNGRIARSYPTSGTRAWQWAPYTGINGHFAHTHVSVLDTDAAKNDTSPWFPEEDFLMALSDEVQQQLATDVAWLRAAYEPNRENHNRLTGIAGQVERVEAIADHNRWNRDVLDGIAAAVSKISAGDGASAAEILDALAARLDG